MSIYETFRDIDSNVLISENSNNAYPEHFHRNIEIIYVRDGIMNATINNQTYECHKDEIIFVPKFFIHEFSTPEQSNVIVLIIPYEMMVDYNTLFEKKMFSPHLSDSKYNKNILKVLTLWLDFCPYNNQHITKGFIGVLLGLLLNHYPMHPFNKNTNNLNLFTRILTYIDENYKDNISLETISRVFNYNKYYISHLFKRLAKVNLKRYINSLRIQHIISSYVHSKEQNLSDIIFQHGFNNMQTFYRFFSNIYKVPPKQFLNNIVSINNLEHNIQNF